MSDHTKTYTDIKEIQMVRSIKPPMSSSSDNIDRWLTLGTFSWAYIRNLSVRDSKVPLQDLRSNKTFIECADHELAYSHPVYILNTFPVQMKPTVDGFWEFDSNFMMITHANGVEKDRKSFEAKIQEVLQQEQKQLTEKASCSDKQNQTFCFQYYRTLDLTDLVIITKSNSLRTLLHVIDSLYKTPTIKDIHSYGCIRPALLNDQSPIPADDIISRVTIRFAVRDARKCDALLKRLQTYWHSLTKASSCSGNLKPVLVTGTEDIDIVIEHVQSSTLCQLYSDILYKETESLQEAVNDMVSRIGITQTDGCDTSSNLSDKKKCPEETVNDTVNGGVSKNDSNEETRLQNYYGSLKDTLNETINDQFRDSDSHHLLVQILDSLMSISKNSILSQLCYILAKPIKFAVNKLSGVNIPWSPQHLYEFLDGVVYLMGHITRMESSLVRYPETRPLAMDIPASIMEFDLALVDRCAAYLKSRELGQPNQDKRDYAFLLVPKLCDRITIHDHFNGNEKERLLYVSIPLSLIYDPHRVACSLIHEVAHHSGERTRCRKWRLKCLCFCAASTLAAAFDMHLPPDMLREITQELMNQLNLDAGLKLKDISNQLHRSVIYSIQNTNQIERYLLEYIEYKMRYGQFDEDKAADYFRAQMLRRGELASYTGTSKVINDLAAIETLFSECYADITMVSLLGMDVTEYLALFIDDYNWVKKQNKREGEQATSYVKLIERVGLVVSAFSKQPPIIDLEEKLCESGLQNEVLQFIQELDKDGSRSSERFPHPEWLLKDRPLCYHAIEALDAVLDYLGKCLEAMDYLDKMDRNVKARETLKNNYILYTKDCDLASLQFFKEISEFRKRILTP